MARALLWEKSGHPRKGLAKGIERLVVKGRAQRVSQLLFGGACHNFLCSVQREKSQHQEPDRTRAVKKRFEMNFAIGVRSSIGEGGQARSDYESLKRFI
jgi:hypothetical protein